jgi:hypothetical protein
MGKAGMPEMAAPNRPETAQSRCQIILKNKRANPMICPRLVGHAGAVW